MLFLAAVAEGASVAIGIPARQALIGDFIEDDELGNAMALQQVGFNAARVVMPSVAGVLIAIAFIGMGWTFVMLTVMYAVAALIMMMVPSAPRRPMATTSFVSDFVEGLRYVRSRPSILTLVGTAYVVEADRLPVLRLPPRLRRGASRRDRGPGDIDRTRSADDDHCCRGRW